jgi:UDP-N-acetylmuramate dehydrogenase
MSVEESALVPDHLADDLIIVLGAGAVRANESLARYTAFRIGGPAELLAVAESSEALQRSVMLAWEHQVPYRVLGAGSNVLVSDAGIAGLVVLNRARAVAFSSPEDQAQRTGRARVRAESGASLSTVVRQCVARGLAGLEWAANIPGTVGGAVFGNAGAWGGDVASALVCARVLEPGDAVAEWPVARFEYGYRTSVLKRLASQVSRPVVLDAEFALQGGDRKELESRVARIAAQRKASQPPGATCGSVFKNPQGDYAGRLIEAAGLKETRKGAAEISPVHANFIVNHGGATAADVRALIELARQTVQARFGVSLEMEIELIGDWPGEIARTDFARREEP